MIFEVAVEVYLQLVSQSVQGPDLESARAGPLAHYTHLACFLQNRQVDRH